MDKIITSSVSGRVPTTTNLSTQQVAVNTADGAIYANDGNGNIIQLNTTIDSDLNFKGAITITSETTPEVPDVNTHRQGDYYVLSNPDNYSDWNGYGQIFNQDMLMHNGTTWQVSSSKEAFDGIYVNIDGDQMNGPLTLPSGTPTNDNHATNKKFVTDLDATSVKLSGNQNVSGRKRFTTTDSLKVPVGDTSERGTGEMGAFRFNSDTGEAEMHNGVEWASVGGGGIPEYVIKTIGSTYSLDRNAGVLVDTTSTGGDVTITLPDNGDGVIAGDWISIGMYTTADHNIIIKSSDHKIMGLSEDFVINVDYQVLTFSFVDTVVGWKIVQAVGESESPQAVKTVVKGTYEKGTTTFDIVYDVGYVDVFVGGFKLADTEYTADDGATVVLNNGLMVESYVYIQAWNHMGVEEINSGMVLYDDTNSDLSVDTVKAALDVVTKKSELLDKVLTEYANPNLIINGDMGVWQRSTDFTGKSGYQSVDRWRHTSSTTRVQRWDYPTGAILTKYAASVSGTGTYIGIEQRIEEGYKLIGQQITFSFQADFDSSDDPYVFLRFHKISDGSVISTGISIPIVTTSGWNRYIYTVDLDDLTEDVDVDADDVMLKVQIIGNGSNTATSEFRITAIKLESGSVATPFVADDPQTNLAKCQRYYYRDSSVNGTYAPICPVIKFGASSLMGTIPLPVRMRITPEFVISDAGHFRLIDQNAAVLTDVTKYTYPSKDRIGIVVAASGLASGDVASMFTFNSTVGWYEADAEL